MGLTLDKTRTKQLSIISMISLTVFLNFMDVKDLYYKITMCGPNPSWSFSSDIHEVLTDIDLTQVLKENNGTRTTSHNQWNALASMCDSLVLYKLEGKVAHLSAAGTGCYLGDSKREETLVFVGSMRIDALMWGAGLLADAIHEPLPQTPYTSSVYTTVYNLPESSYRASLQEVVDEDDVSILNVSTRAVFDQFGTRLDLWEDTLCYEIMPLPERGIEEHNIIPSEYGCIWSDPNGNNLHEFHINEVSAKYFRVLSEWVGWNWHTLDFLYVSNIYIRARLRMVSIYSIDNYSEIPKVHHWIATDLGVDGVLYFFMLMIEVMMIVINSVDSWVVAMVVVRPLIAAGRRERVYASASTLNSSDASSLGSARETPTFEGESKDTTTTKAKDETLSRVLLYTDLSSVSFRKQVMGVLMIIDAFFSWVYIIPNSTVFAWSTSLYQLTSAYLSNFRVWSIVLVIIDRSWRWTFVLVNERFAALITEFTHISSFEIMVATLISVSHSFEDLLNVCLFKWGATDRQREMFPTVPGLLSFYNSYSKYSYGDRSNEGAGSHVIYDPLIKIIGWAIFFSLLVVVSRLIFNVSLRAYQGTLRKDISSFWRTYQRNSVEVFMNDPLRAKALVRSQAVMSYRFGRAVFIRPFVYLEQNYYIYRGRFRRRPLIPIVDLSDSINGAEVNVKGYQLEGVYHDEATNRIRKKKAAQDTQIPLC